MRTIAAITVLLSSIAMAFTPPDEKTRRDAIGDLSELSAVLQRALTPDINSFDPIPKPGPSDWLAVHEERGQTFGEFKAAQTNRPTQTRRVIYLQPLGDFAPERSPSINKLQKFAAAFFAMEVKSLPPINIDASKFTKRRNPYTGNSQILTGDVLNFLKTRLPADAFCILAITMEDLYPEPAWNFVFGQASLRDRVGVYSFARYLADDPKLVLRRSCKVLAHETSHMFGMAHCIFYRCIMNGSNHLAESDARPMTLCPIDLRKLQWSVGFDVQQRERTLQPIIDRLG